MTKLKDSIFCRNYNNGWCMRKDMFSLYCTGNMCGYYEYTKCDHKGALTTFKDGATYCLKCKSNIIVDNNK